MVLVMKVIHENDLFFGTCKLIGCSSLLSVGMFMMVAFLKTVLPTFKRSVLYVKCRVFLTLPDTW